MIFIFNWLRSMLDTSKHLWKIDFNIEPRTIKILIRLDISVAWLGTFLVPVSPMLHDIYALNAIVTTSRRKQFRIIRLCQVAWLKVKWRKKCDLIRSVKAKCLCTAHFSTTYSRITFRLIKYSHQIGYSLPTFFLISSLIWGNLNVCVKILKHSIDGFRSS